MSFQSLKLTNNILKAISEKGYLNPTQIQAEAIPVILEGKDLLGCAQTGTGKTAAFSIPILQLLSTSKNHNNNDKKRPIRGLILSPTRELAIQIGESLKDYGKYSGVSSTVVCGGLSKTKQIRSLQKGIDILVATPGRLLDIINEINLSLKHIEMFVLDEADTMLDMGFIHDIKTLLAKLPHKRQSLFFSATMIPEIVKLANTILVNPSKIKVAPVSSTAASIEQLLYFVDKENKNNLLVDILKNDEIQSCLIFTRTKHSADKVVKMLASNNIKSEAIHGNKSQNARQEALLNFKSKKSRILVATDIASRGIDIDHLEYVLNYDLPNVAETYVHRIGRTGRAGKTGVAFSFCDAEEKSYLQDIEKLINKKLIVISNHAYPATSAHKGGGSKTTQNKPSQPKKIVSNDKNKHFSEKPNSSKNAKPSKFNQPNKPKQQQEDKFNINSKVRDFDRNTKPAAVSTVKTVRSDNGKGGMGSIKRKLASI